jgi:antitoxin component YwqK of YwqJK toxin-antitoxin module
MRSLVLSIIILPLSTCYSCRNTPEAPDVFVNAATNGFVQRQGVLYWKNKPFSGNQYALYATGDTAFVTPFYNGREYGVAKQWYANRQLKEVRHFVHGRKTGVHTGWWENGQLQFVYHFSEDAFEGAVQEWYSNGRLFRQMHYTNGTENGLQQIWQPNGSVFANYEALNGRNYGLTGTMHCKNYWDKVVIK